MKEKIGLIRKFFLMKLFDDQIKKLKSRGCPEQIIIAFQSQRNPVIKKASEMTFESGRIPFLPVILMDSHDISDLMTMIKNTVSASLDPAKILDLVKTPKDSYYIFDVDNGELVLGKMPDIVKRIFKQQKRSPLTVAEIIALCVHTSVFSWQYGVWAIGSRYESDEFTPIIIAGPAGLPSLEYDKFYFSDYALKRSPSCGSR